MFFIYGVLTSVILFILRFIAFTVTIMRATFATAVAAALVLDFSVNYHADCGEKRHRHYADYNYIYSTHILVLLPFNYFYYIELARIP